MPETRHTQYRAVGERRDRHGQVVLDPPSENLAWVEASTAVFVAEDSAYKNVRIQTRTVTESQWEDITDAK